MAEVLYIKANPKGDQASNTFNISEEFIKAYREYKPEDKITTLDLYRENIRPLTANDLSSIFDPHAKEDKNHPILKYAHQFAGADKYVIAAPMWNLSIPAILKAYIDYICIAGINFTYTENGPEGLCKGRKAFNITARGGLYSEGPFQGYEMGDRYLRTILGFLGITDMTTITAEKLDVVGENKEEIMRNAIIKAHNEAGNF